MLQDFLTANFWGDFIFWEKVIFGGGGYSAKIVHLSKKNTLRYQSDYFNLNFTVMGKKRIILNLHRFSVYNIVRLAKIWGGSEIDHSWISRSHYFNLNTPLRRPKRATSEHCFVRFDVHCFVRFELS